MELEGRDIEGDEEGRSAKLERESVMGKREKEGGVV